MSGNGGDRTSASAVPNTTTTTTTTTTTPSYDNNDDETLSVRLNRLSVARPAVFTTAWQELGFCTSIMLSQMMAEYFISGFNLILPPLSTALRIRASAAVWPASAFSLTAGALLLIFGRLADMYGAYRVYVCGLAWHAVWSVVGGFVQSEVGVDVVRALQGLGPAAYLPAAVGLMGGIYRRPGPRKNRVFSIYGACAPVGFFLGILFSGVAGEVLSWRWYFWIGGVLTTAATLLSYYCVPVDAGRDHAKVDDVAVGMDWWGCITLVPGLVLVVFALTQSSRAPHGWRTWYIPFLLIAGIVCLGAFAYVQARVATQPLLPPSMFRIKHMTALSIALFFSYSCLGTWLFHTTFLLQHVRHTPPLLTVAYFVPFGLGGFVLPSVCGLFLHLVPGTLLLLISGCGWLLATLPLALAPYASPSSSHFYWCYVFPSMVGATLSIDVTYNITNIWITTNMPGANQGLAGAWIWALMFAGISVMLGVGDVVHSEVMERSGEEQAYRATFFFVAACAGVALAAIAAGVRVPKAESGLNADERAALERELQETEETT